MSGGPVDDARAAAEAVARRSYGKLVAYLAARTRDLAAAEDALADAFAEALRAWPASGAPASPEAWLLTVARRKLVDAARRRKTRADAADHLKLIEDERLSEEAGIPDERLKLMFACAHPAIEPAIRAPLMLQTVLGFDAATIASAFLVAPSAMGQRLSRAKAKIKLAGVPFRIPERADIPQRLAAVLDAIYAVFSEGWADPLGADARRSGLSQEAIFLGRLVTSLTPDEAEAHGLLSLMLHAEARRGARRDARGEFVPLAEQNPLAWDGALIADGENALHVASRLPGAMGRYQIEAAIQSAHAARRHAGAVDWLAITALYDLLLTLTASPVVAVNRAVAIGESLDAKAGLAALDEIEIGATLATYQPYWAARAALLARAGGSHEAALAYQRAAGLEQDPAVRRFLIRRCAELPAPR